MRVTHGVGDIQRQGGYGGTYSKATFGMWLYMETPVNGQIQIEFCVKDTPTGWFSFPLNFTGWRRAHLKYSFRSDFEGKVSPAVDTIVFRAPDTDTGGTTYVDLVVYNGLMDYRQQWVPGKQARRPVPIAVSSPDLARPPELAEHEAARAIWKRLTPTQTGVADDAIDALEQEAAQWGIAPNADTKTAAVPVVKTPSFYNEFGLEMTSPAKPCKLMLTIARTFHQSTSALQQERLATLFLAFSDHLHDQGMAADSGFPWNWYNGRDFAEATLLMADNLRHHARLVREATYFDYNWDADSIFRKATRTSMDDLHIDTRYRLYGALMQATPEDQVRWLRAFTRQLSEKILLETGDGFKPDGSAFHHGFHYFAYANYSLNSLTHIVELLGDTPFHISDAAQARLKKVLLAMRFYCNLHDLPLPLCGRHPHSQAFSPGKLLKSAGASMQSQGRLDPDLAAAYLRFHPDQAQDPRFAVAGIVPEPSPQGNLAMNYAGLMAHRRAHWLAVVKGYSKYVTHGETYADNNRYGRYLSNGYLDILGGGKPVSRRGSGCVEEGWDWNRLDGTTVIYLPPAELVPPSKGTEMLRSDQTFVGGLSHRKRNGIFVMRIHGAKHHNPTFRADKTYFLFDDRIICLGTGITDDDKTHPTQTNLFQKHLGDEATPQGIVVDGMAVHELPLQRLLDPERRHSLLDPQGTGYLIPAGQRVSVARRCQRFPEQHNKKELAGVFATAWIDHGVAPADGGYEYAVLVNTSPTALAGFAEAMKSDETAPYRVLRKDDVAHIVWDQASGSWAYVFLKALPLASTKAPPTTRVRRWWHPVPGAPPLPDPPLHPVVSVDRPCLVMVEELADGARALSVADPDLNLVEGISQVREVSVVLRGQWEPNGARNAPGVRIRRDEGVTRISADCQRGETIEVPLRRR